MALRLAGVARAPALSDTLTLLRPVAAAGFVLAAIFGALLFVTQAGTYLASGWFLAKITVIVAALANVALHLRLIDRPAATQRRAAIASLVLWPTALILGRMVGYA